MQVNTNTYARENPLLYQTTQKPQESATSFEVLLSTQSNQANSTNNTEENQESQKSGFANFSDFLNKNGVDIYSKEGQTLFVAQIVSAIQQYAKENNMDVLKVNWQRANVSWNQSFANASRSEQKEMLENVLEVLKSETAIQRGSYMGQTESPEHFEKHKNSAIDILSEILQGIKA